MVINGEHTNTHLRKEYTICIEYIGYLVIILSTDLSIYNRRRKLVTPTANDRNVGKRLEQDRSVTVTQTVTQTVTVITPQMTHDHSAWY